LNLERTLALRAASQAAVVLEWRYVDKILFGLTREEFDAGEK